MKLKRIEAPNGPVYYVSPQLTDAGIPHAFSTRLGGVSAVPFDSLNLGNPSGDVRDDRANILANYDLLLNTVNLSGREHCWLHQIHGDVVSCVERGISHDNDRKGDALATKDPARVLSVRVADCCPILLATNDGRCVAAVHSGWRGTVVEVVLSAMKAMNAIQPTPLKNILAAIGPCIGLDAFEVGLEVLAEFKNKFGVVYGHEAEPTGKARVDIREYIKLSLLNAGLPEANIDTTDLCTHRDIHEFYSHRRENGVTGRMAAVIGAPILTNLR